MTVLARFEDVLTTSGIAVLVALVCSVASRQFATLGDFVWWFGATAIPPIRGFVFGWTLLALIFAVRRWQTISKTFKAVFCMNLLAAALLLVSILSPERIAT